MTEIQHHPRRALVTGGSGFIGSTLIRHLLGADPNLVLINLDALTYAGREENLQDVVAAYPDRYIFVHDTILNRTCLDALLATHEIDTIIHLAAESHVDRSITGPATFLETNITGTYTLLEAARQAWDGRDDVRFHHVSTDEVYGSLGPEGYFTESTPYDPSSPYSASKAASDHIVRAWHRTYGLPVTLSNCSNNYGPYQYPEKLIPLMIQTARAQKPLPVYGDGMNVRDWLHVEDHAHALDRVVRYAQTGRTYNIGGDNEWTNIDLVRLLCTIMDELHPRPGDAPHADLISFVTDRLGHDQRYAIDATRIHHELGWSPSYTFEDGLRQTVAWYLENDGGE